MHIFNSRWRKEDGDQDLRLVPVDGRQSFDVIAMIAKALVVFVLVYGSMGGFISAYGIEYNKGLCMLVIFGCALLYGAVYGTGKRWATNLLNILMFIVYLYLALQCFWIINSGCYAILNRVYETARSYLHITTGTEYVLVVEDEYAAVTGFVLFIGIAGTILFNILLQQKASLLRTVLLTLPLYGIPFYFEKMPELIYVLLLLTGYLTVAILQAGGVQEDFGKQMRYVFPVAAAITVVLVRMIYFAVPQKRYDSMVPISESKKATEGQMSNFAQFGVMALFMHGRSGGGISGGALGRGSAVMPDYETDLIVRYTPYSYQPVYLKAFTGKDYKSDRWTPARQEGTEDARMIGTVKSRADAWEQRRDSRQARGVMEIENVGASPLYNYRPYYTDYDLMDEDKKGGVYVYYIPEARADTVEGAADECYVEVPENCLYAVRRVCEDAGFSGTPEEIAAQIKELFQTEYSYTLRPGIHYGRSDFITHFLLENRKGYCAHFASAATMLFRYMGVPARYVEGYVFSYTDVVLDGKLVEDAVYEDYYDGFSFLGETGLVEVEIPDANAHAWVEIYLDGRGWVIVDPTPASEEEEEATSFWDAFWNTESGGGGLNFGQSDIGAYLEDTLGRTATVLLAAAAAMLLFLIARRMFYLVKETRMPEQERVKLEYRKLTGYLSKKHREFALLRTIREQADWLESAYGVEVSDDLRNSLYVTFFAGEAEGEEWGAVRTSLEKLRSKVRYGRKK